MNTRTLKEVIQARATSDGAGVQLHRVFGGANPERFDPFLMLDDFGSDNPDDYIAGFPPHPHRGFRTLTYMLEGEFEHRDHMGNVGVIGQGGVQWMNAGSGVIHSEMPIQKTGRLRGFQLWLNLPAKDKLMIPSYENIQANQVALFKLDEQVQIKAIAGEAKVNEQAIVANQQIPDTQPIYLDVWNNSAQATSFSVPLPGGNTALLYVVEGAVEVTETRVSQKHLLRFSESGELAFTLAAHSRVLLLSGKPLREPIVQHGPFVMNSDEEIQQAIADYQNGTLTEAEPLLG